MTRARPFRNRRNLEPLVFRELLAIRHAIRVGTGATARAWPELVAKADQARAVYADHRSELLARLERMERDGGEEDDFVAVAVAELIAFADHDGEIRARAALLAERAKERDVERRRRRDDDG